MRVLVCGGRDFNYRRRVFEVLDAIHERRPITFLIEGGARGADALGRAWAIVNDIPHQTFEADWALYGKRAGRVRNARMLREGLPDLVVAFPGGVGTAHMTGIAKEAGTLVYRA